MVGPRLVQPRRIVAAPCSADSTEPVGRLLRVAHPIGRVGLIVGTRGLHDVLLVVYVSAFHTLGSVAEADDCAVLTKRFVARDGGMPRRRRATATYAVELVVRSADDDVVAMQAVGAIGRTFAVVLLVRGRPKRRRRMTLTRGRGCVVSTHSVEELSIGARLVRRVARGIARRVVGRLRLQGNPSARGIARRVVGRFRLQRIPFSGARDEGLMASRGQT